MIFENSARKNSEGFILKLWRAALIHYRKANVINQWPAELNQTETDAAHLVINVGTAVDVSLNYHLIYLTHGLCCVM